MKKVFRSVVFGLLMTAMLVPSFANAASEITIKGCAFLKGTTTDVNYLNVQADGAKLTVNIIGTGVNATKFSGMPSGMTAITDWLNGDSLTVTGKVRGYENGFLTITATKIAYTQTGVKASSENKIVERVVAGENRIVVSSKTGDKYVLMTIDNVNKDNGPRLTGVTGLDKLNVGSTVSVIKIKRGTTETMTQIKKVSEVATVKRVLDVTSESDRYFLGKGLEKPVMLVRKNNLVFQNSSNTSLFIRMSDDVKRYINFKVGGVYLEVKPGTNKVFEVKSNAPLNQYFVMEAFTGELVSGELKSSRNVINVDTIVIK